MANEKIGIIGGGQLGRMLTPPALELGFEVTVLENDEKCPAAQVGAHVLKAKLTDGDAIKRLVEISDVTTWEIEHIPAEVLVDLYNTGENIQSDPNTLLMIQDKVRQKKFLASHGIPVAPFSDTLDESKFVGSGPYVVKSRKGGYDGRGNLVVSSLDDPAITAKFGETDVYAEQAVQFIKELSVIAARDIHGAIELYPVVETIHENNICHTVMSPSDIHPLAEVRAKELAREVMTHLQGAGVFAIEMFATADNEVMVNEIAPRVHNSGHLTIEANNTSQFEQHIRAITGLPLGSTDRHVGAAAMVNILGTREGLLDRTGLAAALAPVHGVSTNVHFYGKTPKPARKIGHITATTKYGDETGRNIVRKYAQSAREKLNQL